jgi:hypothetical protein
LTVHHANMPTPLNERTSTFSASSTASLANLFPFTTPYSAWAGTCGANRAPSNEAETVTVPAGGVATPNPIPVEMPVLNIRVRRNGANYANADVRVRPFDTGCGSTSIQLPPSNGGGIPGTEAQRAFPYGTYTVCADDNSRRVERQITLNTTNAVAATDLVIPTSGTSSQCT